MTINHSHRSLKGPLHSFILRTMLQLSKAVRGSNMATPGFMRAKKYRENNVTYSIINVRLVL